MNHEFYMKKCLELALKGKGNVAPNPMVGCVIVLDEKIIGKGYHEIYGGPHAEVNAINAVTDLESLKRATLYVNLEPCSHFGKTPPCANLILEKGIPHVVIGVIDNHSKVAGKGIERLRNAGVKVEFDIIKDQCLELNKRFHKYHSVGLPYIILKWAESKDGFVSREKSELDKGLSNWITGEESKVFVHQQRATEQAIIVGKSTIINDNPSLTTRLVNGSNPLRVVICNSPIINSDYTILNDEHPTLIFNKEIEEVKENKEWIKFDGTIGSLLRNLASRGIHSVIVEGGSKTLQQFIQENLWDEAYNFIGNVEFGSGLKAPSIKKQPLFTNQLGTDKLIITFNK